MSLTLIILQCQGSVDALVQESQIIAKVMAWSGALLKEYLVYYAQFSGFPGKYLLNLINSIKKVLGTIKACPRSAVHASNHAQYAVNWKYGVA